jgi:hypothetical protein
MHPTTPANEQYYGNTQSNNTNKVIFMANNQDTDKPLNERLADYAVRGAQYAQSHGYDMKAKAAAKAAKGVGHDILRRFRPSASETIDDTLGETAHEHFRGSNETVRKESRKAVYGTVAAVGAGVILSPLYGIPVALMCLAYAGKKGLNALSAIGKE